MTREGRLRMTGVGRTCVCARPRRPSPRGRRRERSRSMDFLQPAGRGGPGDKRAMQLDGPGRVWVRRDAIMASNYTANYGLCQWEPGDKFLREEFNQDNGKIDGAIAAAAAKGSQALAGLEPLSQNVYNLILRDYYEKRETGWKKALLFDGFLDNSRIQQLTGGLTLGDKRLSLQGSGMGNVELGLSGGMGGYLEETRTVTATGSGALTGFTFEVYSELLFTSEVVSSYTLTVNGAVAATGRATIPSIASKTTVKKSFFFSPQPVLKKGDTFSLKLEANGSGYHYTLGSGGLGGTFKVSSNSGTEGRMTAKAAALPAAGGALGWVRHRGGTVRLSLRDSGGTEHALTVESTQDSATVLGEKCRETSFRLTEDLAAGAWSVLLELTLGADSEAHIFDYGLAWR